MAKFTPGPYVVIDLIPKLDDWTGASHILTAKEAPGGVAAIIGGLGEEIERAQANLFAAAPDLYDAMVECEEYFDARADADHDGQRFVANKEMNMLSTVRAALAKADGKAAA